MKKFLLISVIVFSALFGAAKNSYLFNRVLVNGAYEQTIYPTQDVVYLQQGEKYSASYYLNVPFVSGKTTIEILSAPGYLDFKPVFNDSTATGFHFYWANNESGQEAFFQTDTTANGFVSSWFCFRSPGAGWLGDIEFINDLEIGDSIQYRITNTSVGMSEQNYRNSHVRTIKCVASTNTGLKIGQTLSQSELANPQITAYPNPFSGELIVNSSEMADVCLLDITGRVLSIQRLNLGINRIPTADLKPGIYFVKADKTVVKLIKK